MFSETWDSGPTVSIQHISNNHGSTRLELRNGFHRVLLWVVQAGLGRRWCKLRSCRGAGWVAGGCWDSMKIIMDWIIPIQQPYGPSTSFLFSEHDPNMSDFHSSLTPCYETHGKKKTPLGPLGSLPIALHMPGGCQPATSSRCIRTLHLLRFKRTGL